MQDQQVLQRIKSASFFWVFFLVNFAEISININTIVQKESCSYIVALVWVDVTREFIYFAYRITGDEKYMFSWEMRDGTI